MRSLTQLYQKFFLSCGLFLLIVSWTANIHAANIYLTWEDTSDNEDGFKVQRLIEGVIDATVTVPANVTSYLDSGLPAGVVYCYRALAYNSAGDSDPSNEVCAAAENTTLTVSPTTVAVNGTVSVAWSGITGPSAIDWIGLYTPGAAETNFINYIYVSCSTIAGSTARATASCSYPLPPSLSPGNYELRLFANGEFTRRATSTPFTVVTTGTTPIAPTPTLAVSPTTVAVNGTVSAAWSGITAPSPIDWIGLYTPGAAETNFINYIYVSCSTIAGSTARATASCSYPLPVNLNAGNYELRLFADGGFTRLATSGSLTVTTTPAIVTTPGSPSGLTIQLTR